MFFAVLLDRSSYLPEERAAARLVRHALFEKDERVGLCAVLALALDLEGRAAEHPRHLGETRVARVVAALLEETSVARGERVLSLEERGARVGRAVDVAELVRQLGRGEDVAAQADGLFGRGQRARHGVVERGRQPAVEPAPQCDGRAD